MSVSPSLSVIRVPSKVIEVFDDSDAVKQFRDILGAGAQPFIKSALIAIAASTDLQACSPQSLVIGAVRSATLGLSLDPALRQAYLVPRKGQACFQAHYHGLYDLAVRTGRYRFISVMPIHRGDRVFENPLTGIHCWQPVGTSILASPAAATEGLHTDLRDVTAGRPTEPVIGYLGYFKTIQGFEKSIWMTLGEIEAHAMLWSPESFRSERGAWQDKKKRSIMEMKTVFRALSRFMDLSGSANDKLREALAADDEVVTVEATDVPVPAASDPDPDLVYPEPEPLVIEPVVPAVSRAVPNVLVTDYEWSQFSDLVTRAVGAGVEVLTYNRTKMTPALIAGASVYLKNAIAKKVLVS